MKTVILVGDGMGDYPCPELENRTPLQAAEAPFMRKLAAAGNLHMVKTVVDRLPPGSDVCNLGLLGYNSEKNYTGRAPIEAAGQHLVLHRDDVALRCNLVTVENEMMKDYAAGHITTEEAEALIASLDQALGREGRAFKPGVSYRHLLLWRNGPADAETTPPHDFTGKPLKDHGPVGPRAGELAELMLQSRDILANHPVNRARTAAGKNPANQIWLWGQGKIMRLRTFAELYGLTGTVISAVDLVRGIGVLAGLDVAEVAGATGFVDTNYAGKVAAACQALQQQDMVYLHVEAPDECGHLGDAPLKTKAISDFDARVVGPMWQWLEERGEPYQLIITMDHRTPVTLRKHSREPVPLIHVKGPTGRLGEETAFDEFVNGGIADCVSYEFIQAALKK